MAHNIKEMDTQEGRSQAWHGLSVIIPDLNLDNCCLNKWELEPQPLYLNNGVKTDFAILACSDAPDHFIGAPFNPETFKPISNRDFLNLIRDSISGTKHVVTSAGSVRNRGRVFVSIALNGMESFKAAGRDFSAFLNFGNGHDKSSVLWVNTSSICTVCDNTFSANLFTAEQKESKNDDLKARVRHTKHAALKLPALADLIDKAIGVQGEFAAAMDSLAKEPVRAPQGLFAGFIGRNVSDASKGLSTRSVNTSLRLVELFKSGKGNRGESLADAFSAVTDFYSHESSGGDNRLKQVLSSEYGSGQEAKSSFWRIVKDDDRVEETTRHGLELLAATKD